MMGFFFAAAVCFLTAGHFFRMLRWKQFIAIYEQPDPSLLLRALTIGYAVSFFIPFRAGDAVRAVISGRHMKNGVSLSLATLILEYLMDIPLVSFMFLLIALAPSSDTDSFRLVALYGALTIAIVVLGLVAVRFSGYMKAAAKAVCSIFNQRIKYVLLFFLWGVITAFRDVFLKISKTRLLLYTLCMWVIYIVSYIFLAQAIVCGGMSMDFTQIVTLLFSRGGFSLSNLATALRSFAQPDKITLMITAYIAAPIILLPVITVLLRHVKLWKRSDPSEVTYERVLTLLPWVNEQESLHFLESYFSAGSSEKLKKYIEANRDIHILQDFTAGSNAIVMLCMNETDTFYRKYAFGKDGNKLYEQLQWIKGHQTILPLPVLTHEHYSDGYCIYDMEYNAAAVGLFHYIHSVPRDSSWKILEAAIENLRNTLHTKNTRKADCDMIARYIDEKVYSNLRKIESAKELRKLLEYDTLVINGESFHNLNYLKQWLNKPFLTRVFAEDMYADIHGDFTVENVICFESNRQSPFYFIDPNIWNIHDSPALDYAKLLQSLHGGYEFLMRTNKAKVCNNEIQFISSCSTHYVDIYSKYHNYLQEHFTYAQLRSIYFHEVIHWLRLMPYKIENDRSRVALFFAGLIKVFNDTIKWYGANALKEADKT